MYSVSHRSRRSSNSKNRGRLRRRKDNSNRELLSKDDERSSLSMLINSGSTAARAKSETPITQSNGSKTELNSVKGNGFKLPKDTRSLMESGFGADFRGVKIHTDDSAVKMSRELNSQAFTCGKDIYFNKGKYNPNSSNGKLLLAHELTHVIQQGGNKTHVQCQHIKDTGWRYKPPKEVKRSIAEIQSIIGTTPDGIYGPNTKAFVEKYQTRLKTLGLYADTVDGKWGKNTDAAHIAFAVGPFHRRGYNCAGFAFKTYQWHNLNPTKTILGTMTKLPSSLNDTKPYFHKFWLWQVDVSVTNTVTGATTPKNRDFHIVGGQTDKKGKGPLSIMSKNGQRPLEGPKPPLQWELETGPAQDQDGNVVPNARWNISNTDFSCYSNDKLP